MVGKSSPLRTTSVHSCARSSALSFHMGKNIARDHRSIFDQDQCGTTRGGDVSARQALIHSGAKESDAEPDPLRPADGVCPLGDKPTAGGSSDFGTWASVKRPPAPFLP
jgi:hypothetical protein